MFPTASLSAALLNISAIHSFREVKNEHGHRRILPDGHARNSLIDKEGIVDEAKSAAKVQKIDNGIEAQKKIMGIPAAKWRKIMSDGNKKNLFSPMEIGILQVASQIPAKIPSEKQSVILIEILKKASIEGIN